MIDITLDNISLLTFGLVYLAGILTSLTPCVYPIIPIVVGYIGSVDQGENRKLFSSLAYVFGLSMVYTLLGVLSALSGAVFGTLTTKWFVYLFFGIFILFLGGSMMEWYYIPIPIITKKKSDSENNTSILRAFFLGLTSGFIASPCTAPVLGNLLIYIALKKTAVVGGLLLFCFSIGMCTFLLIIGIFTGVFNFLPRSGKWLIYVKKTLAFIILGSGIYYIFKAGALYR